MTSFTIEANSHYINMLDSCKRDDYPTLIPRDHLKPDLSAFHVIQRCRTVESCPEKQQKEEKTMDFAFSDTLSDEMQQRTYLRNRMEEINWAHRNNLRTQFYIDPMQAPETPAGLKDRLEKGLYIIQTRKTHEGVEKLLHDYSAANNILWRDPNKPADREGYDKARDALDLVKTKTEDDIRILPPTDGLAALRKFEEWTYN